MKRILIPCQGAAGRVPAAKRLGALSLVALLSLAPLFSLRAASPDLQSTVPRGGQVGTEIKVEFTGLRLEDAEEVVFHGEGITFKDLTPVDARKVEATLVIAPDAPLGEHHLRLRCRSGTSYATNFWVSQFPQVAEERPNQSFDEPQVIPMNVTVEGRSRVEEASYFQVSAKKGERLSVEVEGLRLNPGRGNIRMDPFVVVYTEKREELAVADGSALNRQDSVLSIEVPEDGDYVIEIRDAAYQGTGGFRAHIGNFPRPTGVFPPAVEPGSETEFTLIGDVKGDYTARATAPKSTAEDFFAVFGERDGFRPPSGNRVRLSALRSVNKEGPSDSFENATDGGEGPVAFNGILEQAGEANFFKFTAKKDQRFRIISYAERLGSPLDTVVTVYAENRRSLGSNDDADGWKDSRVDFQAPEDGDYYIRIADMLGRGGKDFVYRIETEPYTPAIDVTMPEMTRRQLQYQKQFDVPRGGYFAMIVNTTRRNFAGDLEFDFPELPPGVTWEAATIPRSVSQAPILLKAAPDAPIGGGMYPMLVKNTDPERPVVGQFKQALDLVRGPQNDVEYYVRHHDELAVAVIEELPFSITVDQPKVPIVRNGTMKLKVRAEREEGYDRPITLRFLYRPPGITSPATITIPGDQTEAEYELNANANAELNTWNVVVTAESDGGNGLMRTAAPFIQLAVEEPFVELTLAMGTGRQGESVAMLGEVEALREFDGEASVQLFGLPAHTETEPVKFAKDAESLAFNVVTSERTPVGQHKAVFGSVTIMMNGEPITHQVASGSVLRVDPAPKEPVAEAPAAAPTERPLSRLEQLRAEAAGEGANP